MRQMNGNDKKTPRKGNTQAQNGGENQKRAARLARLPAKSAALAAQKGVKSASEDRPTDNGGDCIVQWV